MAHMFDKRKHNLEQMFDFIGVSRYASKELRKEPIVSTIPFTPKKSDERPDESTLTDRQRKVLDAIKTHFGQAGIRSFVP